MALIECPDCRRQVSDSALQCIGCGRPMQMAVVTRPAIEALRYEQANASGVICPTCGAENTEKLSIVHASGLSKLDGVTSSAGVGVGGAGLGVGLSGGTISATNQSALSARVAPPKKRSTVGVKIGATVVSWFLLIIGLNVWLPNVPGVVDWVIASIASMIIGAVTPEGENGRWNRETFPREKAKWERSLLCRRCGTIFESSI